MANDTKASLAAARKGAATRSGTSVAADERRASRRGSSQSDDLEAALGRCRAAAREGYRVARCSLEDTEAAIQRVSAALKRSVREIETGRAQASDVVGQLREQLHQVVSELHELQKSSRVVLDARKDDLDEFSIALFGRTMAGKSTLMEILTNGDGHSIGRGAQRTTRDVRAYRWKGLKVTDVPGVAAFEGAEDEQLAYEAATRADLVLFLITDDAPQPAEAECLARVRALGKPVLGICNVKVTLNDEDDIRLFLRKPEKPFDSQRLNALVGQFHAFADRYTPGYRVRFVYTHLHARFLSRQDGPAPHRADLARASRFGLVERAIIDQVAGRGTFLRVKSFIDGAVVPLLELSDRLLEFSAQNSSSGRVLVDKQRQVLGWRDDFRKNVEARIDTLVSEVVGALRDEIPSFAEDNYDREDSGERWSSFVERRRIDSRVQVLQKQIQEECRRALAEIARELEAEIKLVADLAGDRRIKMDSVVDGKRTWNWGTAILSGGLTLAAVILGSGPLGWAAAAVGTVGWLVSLFMDDREAKVRRQRDKLARHLNNNVDAIERNLRKGLGDWFSQRLLREQLDVLVGDLHAITRGLFQLADAQRSLAWTLNRQQKDLHRALLREALDHLGCPGLDALVLDVARVPGLAMTLLIEPSTRFPAEARSGIEDLLGERVGFVVNTMDPASILSQAIGKDCDRRRVSIESKIRVAHLPIGVLDAVGRSRVRLAQQLTELHVVR